MGETKPVLKDPCTVCRVKESTGILIRMCNECFEDFDLMVRGAKTQEEKDSLAKIAAAANPFRDFPRGAALGSFIEDRIAQLESEESNGGT